MSSSSSPLNNTAAAGFSSNPTIIYHHHHYNPHHHQLGFHEITYNSSDQQNNLVAGMVVQGGHELGNVLMPIDSRVTIIDSSSGKTSLDKAGSGADADAGVGKRKPDIRSKIRTAQGLRDRRVRLSIGIARKFFDLQDLLGFDKPSKTVEWLLTKSNKAILELSAASSSSASSVEITAAAGARDCCKNLSSSRSTATGSAIQAEQVSCDDSFKIVKQKAARDNARARARARTLAKLCAGKVDHPKINQLVMSNNEVTNGGDRISHSSANCHDCSSPSLLKSPASESHKEERNKNGVQDQKLQLELLSYGLSPSLSLDWDIASVIPQQASSAAHRLSFSRDNIEIYNRSTWDQLLNNYRAF